MDFLIISLSIVNFKVWAAFDYQSLSFMCILKLGIWQYKDQYGWNELLMTRTITPSCRAALYYTPKQYFDYNILAVAKFSRKELLNWKKRFLVFEVCWMISFISSFISLPIHCSFSIVKIIFCSKDWSFFIVVIIFCWLSLLKSSWEQHPPLYCCFFLPETLDFPVCWISVRLVWGLSSCDHMIFLLAIKILAWLHCGWW